MQEFHSNQTHFSQEEPILESGGSSQPPQAVATPPVTAVPTVAKKPLTIRVKILIGSSLFLLVLLILLAFASQNNSEKKPVTPQETIVPSAIPEAANPLLDRVDSLKDARTKADPSENDLSFPPVDMELRLN
ncbi:MAG: hypothetical protein WAU07_04280 [Microgenomates group bacterium]